MGGGEVGGMDQKKSVFVKNKIENLFFFGEKKGKNFKFIFFLGEYFGFMGGYFRKILISTYKVDFGVITSDIYL